MQRELVHVPITINQPHVLIVDESSMLTSLTQGSGNITEEEWVKKNM